MAYTKEEVIEIEKSTNRSENFLIDRVGFLCASKIKELIGKDNKILILSYKGNNGQDGLSIAHNLQDEYDVSAVLLHDSIQYERYNLNIPLYHKEDLADIIDDYDVIIDCIFGFSFHLPLNDEFKELFNLINSKNKTVISIDINSGAECNTGKYDTAIKSDYTFILGVRKMVHDLSPELSDRQILIDLFNNLEEYKDA